MDRIAVGTVLALSFALLGCAAGADSPGAGCAPGTSSECTCLDGTPSTQICGESGAVIGACQCAAMPVPPGAAPSQAGAVPSGQPAPTMSGTPEPAMQPMTTPPPSMMNPVVPPTMVQPPPTMTDPPDEQEGPSTGASNDGAVPENAHCMAAATWDPEWTAFEEEVLVLTNEARSQPATCGEYGPFEPAAALEMNPILRCSSRLHSLDMGENGYFAHDNQQGEDPFDRMAAAGYMGFTMGENIAKGQQTPAEVVDGWMNSPGHCSNIMNPQYTEIGVGYFEGEAANPRFNNNKLWTQNFGAPRTGRR